MIKFIDQWYIGFDQTGVLGFMTPNGTDAAAEKRKATVERWSSGHGTYIDGRYVYKKPNVKNLSDIITDGFKIKNSISRGGSYYGSQDKWRIADPRGFELEITSKNISIIHKYAGVNPGGEIIGRCRWAREGANNVLVPENAPEWQEATNNSKLLKKQTIQLTDDHIGHVVKTQSTIDGIYLGKYNLIKTYSKDFNVVKNYHMFWKYDSLQVIKEPKAVSIEESVFTGSYKEVEGWIEENKKRILKEHSHKQDFWVVHGYNDSYEFYCPHYAQFNPIFEFIEYASILNVYDSLFKKYKDKYYQRHFSTVYAFKNGKVFGNIFYNKHNIVMIKQFNSDEIYPLDTTYSYGILKEMVYI